MLLGTTQHLEVASACRKVIRYFTPQDMVRRVLLACSPTNLDAPSWPHMHRPLLPR